MPIAYSARLGEISAGQFDAATRKAGLGRFVAAEPTEGGLFGQNVLLTTTEGEFVFRGAPHWYRGEQNDAWQFPKEQLFADLLHADTRAPVAWPQTLDNSGEHFAWPYLIMPRLPGVCLAIRNGWAALAPDERNQVAAAMGETLAELHRLTWSFAGDFDPAARGLTPYPDGYGAHLAAEIGSQQGAALATGAMLPEDVAWLDGLVAADRSTPESTTASYLHNDYHDGNILVEQVSGAWRVSGVVDLMTSNFGDPAADLVRQACTWLDRRPACMPHFLAAYRAGGGAAAPSAPRLALVVAYERLGMWLYHTRPDVDSDWPRGRTFRGWARPYVDRLSEAVLS